jgi:hypothetical protein
MQVALPCVRVLYVLFGLLLSCLYYVCNNLFELSGPMVLELLIASSASKPTKEIDQWHSR